MEQFVYIESPGPVGPRFGAPSVSQEYKLTHNQPVFLDVELGRLEATRRSESFGAETRAGIPKKKHQKDATWGVLRIMRFAGGWGGVFS